MFIQSLCFKIMPTTTNNCAWNKRDELNACFFLSVTIFICMFNIFSIVTIKFSRYCIIDHPKFASQEGVLLD